MSVETALTIAFVWSSVFFACSIMGSVAIHRRVCDLAETIVDLVETLNQKDAEDDRPE